MKLMQKLVYQVALPITHLARKFGNSSNQILPNSSFRHCPKCNFADDVKKNKEFVHRIYANEIYEVQPILGKDTLETILNRICEKEAQ
jgi:hypothetical protein